MLNHEEDILDEEQDRKCLPKKYRNTVISAILISIVCTFAFLIDGRPLQCIDCPNDYNQTFVNGESACVKQLPTEILVIKKCDYVIRQPEYGLGVMFLVLTVILVVLLELKRYRR
jgi:hypothetical protein